MLWSLGAHLEPRNNRCTFRLMSLRAPESVRERLDYVLGLTHQAESRENEINRRVMMLS